MSMRISSALPVLLPALLLGGCGQAAPNRDTPEAARIDCAPNGAAAFGRDCAVESEDGPRGTVLTIRHPDGGFHRLLETRDGRGVVAADGAVKAVVTIVGKDMIEVAIGGDRYRLPATVGGRSPPR